MNLASNLIDTVSRHGSRTAIKLDDVELTYSAMDDGTARVAGGAALPVEVLRGFEGRFDCKLLEGYGLSETSAIASFNHADRDRKPGSIGTPVEGVQMKISTIRAPRYHRATSARSSSAVTTS
jgi:acyl-coenzyme A synthetase/AMP-(fatty) acid ligase